MPFFAEFDLDLVTERRTSGAWWMRADEGEYFPPLTLDRAGPRRMVGR